MEKNLNQINMITTLTTLTAKRVLRRKSTWFWLAVGLIPCLSCTFWILRYMAPDSIGATIKPWDFFQTWVEGKFLLNVYVPIFAFFLGLGTINDEIETRNITFTLVRPLNRSAIAIGRFLGHLLAAVIVLTIVLTANYLANMLFQVESIVGKFDNLLNGLVIFAYGTAAYMGVIAAMGTFAKKFTIFGGIIWLVIDFLLSLIPHISVQAKSIRFNMLSGFFEPMSQTGLGSQVTEVRFFSGMLVCLVVAAISCLLMTRRLRSEIVLSSGAT